MWVEAKKDNKYKFVERYQDAYTEKEHKVSVTLNSQSPQAHKKALKILTAKIEKAKNETRQEKATFEETYDKWFTKYRTTVRPSSAVSADSTKKMIYANFTIDALMGNIDTRLVQDFFDQLDISNSYLKSIKSQLNQFFRYAKKNNYLQSNPMNEVELNFKAKTEIEYEKIENKYLEQSDVEKIIKEFERLPSTTRFARLAEFMFLTGARIGEATILRPDDFDFENKQVKITGTFDKTKGYRRVKKGPTKTVKGTRTIDITPRCIDVVKLAMADNEAISLINKDFVNNDLIFCSRNGFPTADNNFNRALKRVAKKVGLGHKTMSSHIFRHSHISLLAEKGIPKTAIMDRVGHADSKITDEIYTHVTKNMKVNIIKQLEDAGL